MSDLINDRAQVATDEYHVAETSHFNDESVPQTVIESILEQVVESELVAHNDVTQNEADDFYVTRSNEDTSVSQEVVSESFVAQIDEVSLFNHSGNADFGQMLESNEITNEVEISNVQIEETRDTCVREDNVDGNDNISIEQDAVTYSLDDGMEESCCVPDGNIEMTVDSTTEESREQTENVSVAGCSSAVVEAVDQQQIADDDIAAQPVVVSVEPENEEQSYHGYALSEESVSYVLEGTDVTKQDQELQVVPDNNDVADRRYLSESLHEVIEIVNEVNVGSSMGVQLVPTVATGEVINIADSTITASLTEFDQVSCVDHDASNCNEHVDDQQESSSISHFDGGLEEHSAEVLSSCVDENLVPSGEDIVLQQQQMEVQPLLSEDVNSSTQVMTSSDNLVSEASQLENNSSQTAVVFASTSNDDHSYELCVTLPMLQEEATDNDQVTNDDVNEQQIPMEMTNWEEFDGQSLVALTEDGTAIPLTVLHQGPDGHLTYHSDDTGLTSQLLQQIASQQLTFASGDTMSVDLPDQNCQVEVLGMLESSAPGTVIFEASAGGDENAIVAESSGYILDADGSEQSILPDADVLHIPEGTLISGHPVEFQVVGISPENTVPKIEELLSAVRQQNAASMKRISRIKRRSSPGYARRARDTIVSTGSRQYVTDEVNGTVASLDDGQFIELSNTTPSAISPENMQALIQVLQSLPMTARGQTIQITLQTSPGPSTEDTVLSSNVKSKKLRKVSGSVVRIYNGDVVSVDKMPPRSARRQSTSRSSATKTTSDIAIQVSPEFIEEFPVGEDLSKTVVEDVVLPVTAAPVSDETGLTIEEERLRAVVAALNEPLHVRRQLKKPKKSKQVVTVQEQLVIDPKPGVSYYAVVDYLSEHDQDGFSSASEMKRSESASTQSLGFMEDHLELYCASNENDLLRNCSSVLESTVDSSMTVSKLRRSNRTVPRSVGNIDLPPTADDDNQSHVTLAQCSLELQQLGSMSDSQLPIATDDVPVDPTKKRRRRRHRKKAATGEARMAFERFDHKCGYCEFDSSDKILVVEHCIREHGDLPIKTLTLMPQSVGRKCPYCQQVFDHLEFFTHMRCAHSEVHPYKCGYCEFMGRDRNQIRHHIQKKHRLPMKVINLLDTSSSSTKKVATEAESDQRRKRIMSTGSGGGDLNENTVYEYFTDDEELDDSDLDQVSARRGLTCPECKKTFKTLKYLKTHIKMHQAHRYQCGYCDFISIMLHQVQRHSLRKHSDVEPKIVTKVLEADKNPIVSRDIDDVVKKVFSLNTRLPRDPDGSKWRRKWFCPHCDYTCQFGASYRRHLRMHANILPYKCNYCSFKGREKYYVRRHILRMHPEMPAIVVENTPENCAGDTSSDEDFQEKGLRRKRRRRTREQLHAVVPVEEVDPDSFRKHFEMQPIREHMRVKLSRNADENLQNVPPQLPSQSSQHSLTSKSAFARQGGRLPRTKTWSGENISDYIGGREGDKIVCKMCGQRTQAKAFYKHARKHFKVKPFKCGYCNYMAIDRVKIRVHNTLRHPSLPFRIEECHLASIAPQDFLDLIKGDNSKAPEDNSSVSTALDEPQFACPLCQVQVEYDERVLSEHFFAHFEYFPYQCSECDYQDVSEEKVTRHGLLVHAGISTQVFRTNQSKPDGLDNIIEQFLTEGQELIQTKLMALLEQSDRIPQEIAEEEVEKVLEADDGTTVTNTTAEEKSNRHHVFVCSICDRQMNMHIVTVRQHLYGHYNYKPYRCGYCGFLGVSKASVKQHTVTHGSVVPKVELTDQLMPDGLATMIRDIRCQMGQLAKDEQESLLLLTSKRGKLWKEQLDKGECPWCELPVVDGKSFSNIISYHLLGHFGLSMPYRCGNCGEQFSKRNDVMKHSVHQHPELDCKVDDVDENTVRTCLRKFLAEKKQKQPTKSDESLLPSGHDGQKEAEVNNVQKLDGSPLQSDVLHETSNGKPEVCEVVSQDTEVSTAVQTREVLDVTNSEEQQRTEQQSMDEDDDYQDGNIVMIEGVLLTRTLKSDVEDEDDRVRSPLLDDDDDEELSDSFVVDVTKLLRNSINSMSPAAGPVKTIKRSTSGAGTVFVCGYCNFVSDNKELTESHMQEIHSDKPLLFKKGGCKPSRRGRRRIKKVATNTRPRKKFKVATLDHDGDEEAVPIEPLLCKEEQMVTDTDDTGLIHVSVDVIGSSVAVDGAVQESLATVDLPSDGIVYVVSEAKSDDEPQLHSLTPLVPSADDAGFATLEDLEECDENLPKVLEILQLRPARSSNDKE